MYVKKRRTAAGRSASWSRRTNIVVAAQAEIDAFKGRRGNCVIAVPRHLDQGLIYHIRIERVSPGAQNTEISGKQAVSVRRPIGDKSEVRAEVVVCIADAKRHRVVRPRLPVETRDDIVKPVRLVEYAVVPSKNLVKRRVVQRRQPWSNAIGKPYQKRIARSLERIDVAQLVGTRAGALSAHSRSAEAEYSAVS